MDTAWANKYVGIPFTAHGRELATGVDCWGLCLIVLREQYNKTLPSLVDGYGELEPQVIAGFVEVEKPLVKAVKLSLPEEGDIVLIRVFGFPCHVGVYIGNGLVLHSDPMGKGMSRIEPVTRLAQRIEGYYRVE